MTIHEEMFIKAARDRIARLKVKKYVIPDEIAQINRHFNNKLFKLDKDIAAGRTPKPDFDQLLILTTVNALMEAYYNERISSNFYEEGDMKGDALEIKEERIVDHFTVDEEEEEAFTAEEYLRRIRLFFDNIQGYSQEELDYMELHPESKEIFEEEYKEFRIIEEFFKKHEARLSI